MKQNDFPKLTGPCIGQKPPGYGIFISYQTPDDRWTKPINLLKRLNTTKGGSQPVVTPDGKYLFYYALGKFYWVNAKIIKEFKPQESK